VQRLAYSLGKFFAFIQALEPTIQPVARPRRKIVSQSIFEMETEEKEDYPFAF
jgi:hypothetical protein